MFSFVTKKKYDRTVLKLERIILVMEDNHRINTINYNKDIFYLKDLISKNKEHLVCVRASSKAQEKTAVALVGIAKILQGRE